MKLQVKITGVENLDQSLRGKVVLVAEDIVDTGRSMEVANANLYVMFLLLI